jgi:hypothetical protein
MDIGPILTLTIAIFVFVAGCWLFLRRQTHKKPLEQTHTPHSPGSGYDRAEAIRNGVMGDNGHDR